MSDNEHLPGMNDVMRDAMSRTAERQAKLAVRFGFAPADESDSDTDADSDSDSDSGR